MHKPHRFGLPILALLAASCAGNAPPGAAGGEAAPADAVRAPVEVERFAHDNPGFPFSKAVRVDGLVYLSGQIGMDYASGRWSRASRRRRGRPWTTSRPTWNRSAWAWTTW